MPTQRWSRWLTRWPEFFLSDMELDMLADMEVDKLADKEADMVADMVAEKNGESMVAVKRVDKVLCKLAEDGENKEVLSRKTKELMM